MNDPHHLSNLNIVLKSCRQLSRKLSQFLLLALGCRVVPVPSSSAYCAQVIASNRQQLQIIIGKRQNKCPVLNWVI